MALSSSSAGEIPDYVHDFVSGLREAIEGANLSIIHQHYDNLWNKLSDRYFKTAEWPATEKLESDIRGNKVVTFLYQELSFRHLHTKLQRQLTMQHRLDAWRNYTSFFKLVDTADPYPVSLPYSSLWEIIDEFIYQFEEFSQAKAKSGELSAEDVAVMDQNPDMWKTVNVLISLHRLVDISQIRQVLEREKKGDSVHDLTFGSNEFYQWIGYFSIIGLSRMNVILGDYHFAVEVLDLIDISQKKVRFARLPGAYITLHYYLGFSYLMMRRYRDSLKVVERALLYISRMKQYHTRPYDQKKAEKMFALLAILLVYCPRRIDEQVNALLMTEHMDKVSQMQNREIDQLFSFASPKFVDPTQPREDKKSLLDMQRSAFLREISEQEDLPNIRNYVKLYRSIRLTELADLLGNKSDVEGVRALLMCLVQKNQQREWTSGQSPIEGSVRPSVPITFRLSEDMLYVYKSSSKRDPMADITSTLARLKGIVSELSAQ